MNDLPEHSAYTPTTFGQILDRILRVIRGHWKVLVGICAVPPLVLCVSFGVLFGGIMLPILARMPKAMTPAQSSQIAVTFFCAAIPVFLLYVMVLGPSLAAASDAAVRADRGEAITVRDAYAVAFRRYWRFVLLQVLIWIVALGPVLLVELVFGGALAILRQLHVEGWVFVPLVPVGILAMIGCFAFSIFTGLKLVLAFPASAAEDLTASEAMRRSRSLSRGSMGRIFLVLVIVYAICYIASTIGMVAVWSLFGIAGVIASAFHLLPAVRVVAAIAIGLDFLLTIFLSMAFNWVGLATALGVIYNDQRMRLGEQLHVAQ